VVETAADGRVLTVSLRRRLPAIRRDAERGFDPGRLHRAVEYRAVVDGD